MRVNILFYTHNWPGAQRQIYGVYRQLKDAKKEEAKLNLGDKIEAFIEGHDVIES